VKNSYKIQTSRNIYFLVRGVTRGTTLDRSSCSSMAVKLTIKSNVNTSGMPIYHNQSKKCFKQIETDFFAKSYDSGCMIV